VACGGNLEASMQGLAAEADLSALDAFVESHGQVKSKLIDTRAILESVSYLRSHGFTTDQVQRCLVRYFYVDLDLLNEVLTEH
jgi:hypothetical protein